MSDAYIASRGDNEVGAAWVALATWRTGRTPERFDGGGGLIVAEHGDVKPTTGTRLLQQVMKYRHAPQRLVGAVDVGQPARGVPLQLGQAAELLAGSLQARCHGIGRHPASRLWVGQQHTHG